MSSAFISKSRRVRFELTLGIIDLNNVPLVSGTSFIKWHLPSSTSADHRGRTPKCAIKDHRVQFDYSITLPVRLNVGRDGMLAETQVAFEVLQEYSAGGRGERIALGTVRCNLAEYVEGGEPVSPGAPRKDGEGDGVVRRYLMQDSKINSTLKLSIAMKYIEGTRDYIAPHLRTAPVFGGIAGIISSAEPASTTHGVAAHSAADAGGIPHDGDSNLTPMPSLSTTNREIGEMQDMYRRTLAAYWASQSGELKADACIEDIFSGGDGWGKHGRPKPLDQDPSPGVSPNPSSVGREDGRGHHTSRASVSSTGSRSHFGLGHQSERQGLSRKRKGVPRRDIGEVDEFDIREDLRAWSVSNMALS